MIPPELPTIEQLQSQLSRLEANPGSIILIAIEQPERCCNFTRNMGMVVKRGRQSLKTGLQRTRERRALSHDVGAGGLGMADEREDIPEATDKRR